MALSVCRSHTFQQSNPPGGKRTKVTGPSYQTDDLWITRLCQKDIVLSFVIWLIFFLFGSHFFVDGGSLSSLPECMNSYISDPIVDSIAVAVYTYFCPSGFNLNGTQLSEIVSLSSFSPYPVLRYEAWAVPPRRPVGCPFWDSRGLTHLSCSYPWAWTMSDLPISVNTEGPRARYSGALLNNILWIDQCFKVEGNLFLLLLPSDFVFACHGSSSP